MTFGEELVQFARAVDYVDGRSFDRFRKLVDEYTENTLSIKLTRLMIVSGSLNNPRLIPY